MGKQRKKATGEFVWIMDGKTPWQARLVLPKEEAQAISTNVVDIQWTDSGKLQTVAWVEVKFDEDGDNGRGGQRTGRRASRSRRSTTAPSTTGSRPSRPSRVTSIEVAAATRTAERSMRKEEEETKLKLPLSPPSKAAALPKVENDSAGGGNSKKVRELGAGSWSSNVKTTVLASIAKAKAKTFKASVVNKKTTKHKKMERVANTETSAPTTTTTTSTTTTTTKKRSPLRLPIQPSSPTRKPAPATAVKVKAKTVDVNTSLSSSPSILSSSRAEASKIKKRPNVQKPSIGEQLHVKKKQRQDSEGVGHPKNENIKKKEEQEKSTLELNIKRDGGITGRNDEERHQRYTKVGEKKDEVAETNDDGHYAGNDDSTVTDDSEHAKAKDAGVDYADHTKPVEKEQVKDGGEAKQEEQQLKEDEKHDDIALKPPKKDINFEEKDAFRQLEKEISAEFDPHENIDIDKEIGKERNDDQSLAKHEDAGPDVAAEALLAVAAAKPLSAIGQPSEHDNYLKPVTSEREHCHNGDSGTTGSVAISVLPHAKKLLETSAITEAKKSKLEEKSEVHKNNASGKSKDVAKSSSPIPPNNNHQTIAATFQLTPAPAPAAATARPQVPMLPEYPPHPNAAAAAAYNQHMWMMQGYPPIHPHIQHMMLMRGYSQHYPHVQHMIMASAIARQSIAGNLAPVRIPPATINQAGARMAGTARARPGPTAAPTTAVLKPAAAQESTTTNATVKRVAVQESMHGGGAPHRTTNISAPLPATFVKPKRSLSGAEKEARDKKNARARERCVQRKARIADISKKSPEERTGEEKAIYEKNEAQRDAKSRRSRERALQRKLGIDEVLKKPKSERTEIEVTFLKNALEQKERKNQGDRVRRQTNKQQVLLATKGAVRPGTTNQPEVSARGHIQQNRLTAVNPHTGLSVAERWALNRAAQGATIQGTNPMEMTAHLQGAMKRQSQPRSPPNTKK